MFFEIIKDKKKLFFEQNMLEYLLFIIIYFNLKENILIIKYKNNYSYNIYIIYYHLQKIIQKL